jgi:hypothetical protein
MIQAFMLIIKKKIEKAGAAIMPHVFVAPISVKWILKKKMSMVDQTNFNY